MWGAWWANGRAGGPCHPLLTPARPLHRALGGYRQRGGRLQPEGHRWQGGRCQGRQGGAGRPRPPRNCIWGHRGCGGTRAGRPGPRRWRQLGPGLEARRAARPPLPLSPASPCRATAPASSRAAPPLSWRPPAPAMARCGPRRGSDSKRRAAARRRSRPTPPRFAFPQPSPCIPTSPAGRQRRQLGRHQAAQRPAPPRQQCAGGEPGGRGRRGRGQAHGGARAQHEPAAARAQRGGAVGRQEQEAVHARAARHRLGRRRRPAQRLRLCLRHLWLLQARGAAAARCARLHDPPGGGPGGQSGGQQDGAAAKKPSSCRTGQHACGARAQTPSAARPSSPPQSDINDKMRAILIDWLVDVHLKFKVGVGGVPPAHTLGWWLARLLGPPPRRRPPRPTVMPAALLGRAPWPCLPRSPHSPARLAPPALHASAADARRRST